MRRDMALCACGLDLTEHHDDVPHRFKAAGTRYRCDMWVDGYRCSRPRFHIDEGVPCGPLTGKYLWDPEGSTT